MVNIADHHPFHLQLEAKECPQQIAESMTGKFVSRHYTFYKIQQLPRAVYMSIRIILYYGQKHLVLTGSNAFLH